MELDFLSLERAERREEVRAECLPKRISSRKSYSRVIKTGGRPGLHCYEFRKTGKIIKSTKRNPLVKISRGLGG